MAAQHGAYPGGAQMSPYKPLIAADVPQRTKPSAYPAPFAARMQGRIKRQLGDLFDLKNFGVNLTTLAPGAVSSIHHAHQVQDECVYVLTGHPTVVSGEESYQMAPGMFMGFPAGGEAHHLRNDTQSPVTFLEIGDRTPGDVGTYPKDDLVAVRQNNRWVFQHKDGTPYPNQ